MKQKEKRIGQIAIVLLLLVCCGIYVVYRLHPESHKGKNEVITCGEYAANLAQEIILDISNVEKEPRGSCVFFVDGAGGHGELTRRNHLKNLSKAEKE